MTIIMGKSDFFMNEAIEQAKKAIDLKEVPVGAIVVKNNKIIGRGFNCQICHNDPSAHAEVIALRDAAKNIGNYRLTGTTLYVTIEPCAMCAGALVHARITNLIFGARDIKAGAVVSTAQLLENPAMNHRVSWEEGVMLDACGQLLRNFFKERR